MRRTNLITVAAGLLFGCCKPVVPVRTATPAASLLTATTPAERIDWPPGAVPIYFDHRPTAEPIDGIPLRQGLPQSELDWVRFLLAHVPAGMPAQELDKQLGGMYLEHALLHLGGIPFDVGVVYEIAPHFDVEFHMHKGGVDQARLVRRRGEWKKDEDGYLQGYAD